MWCNVVQLTPGGLADRTGIQNELAEDLLGGDDDVESAKRINFQCAFFLFRGSRFLKVPMFDTFLGFLGAKMCSEVAEWIWADLAFAGGQRRPSTWGYV